MEKSIKIDTQSIDLTKNIDRLNKKIDKDLDKINKTLNDRISKCRTKKEIETALKMILYDYQSSDYQLSLIDDYVEKILKKLSTNLIYKKQ